MGRLSAGHVLLVAAASSVAVAAVDTQVAARRPIKHTPNLPSVSPQQPSLIAATAVRVQEPSPAAKLLDVARSTLGESLILLVFLKAAALLIYRVDDSRLQLILTQLAWVVVVQASSRLQGLVQTPTKTLSPEWYGKLVQPSWNPPPWAFPLAWIPLKLAQTIGSAVLWQAIDLRVFDSPAVVLFVVHVALGHVWNVQFFLKQRILTGLLVIWTFWFVLLGATVAIWRESALAGALVAPTVAWVAVAASLNLDTWYLNRSPRRR